MTINLKRQMVGAGVALACFVWAGTAHAANITATETAQEFGVLTGSQFDVSAFIATSALESADASGAFLANSTATGSALVVLTEAGGGNSDWLELVYSGPGGRGTENITAHWRSDADPGGLPAHGGVRADGALKSEPPGADLPAGGPRRASLHRDRVRRGAVLGGKRLCSTHHSQSRPAGLARPQT